MSGTIWTFEYCLRLAKLHLQALEDQGIEHPNKLMLYDYAVLKYNRVHTGLIFGAGTAGYKLIKDMTDLLLTFKPHNLGKLSFVPCIIQYAHPKLKGQIVDHYYQIDRNKAYYSYLTQHKLPIAYKGTTKPNCSNNEYLQVWVSNHGTARFSKPIKSKYKYQIHYWLLDYLDCREYTQYMDQLLIAEPAKAKKLIVAGIGMMSKQEGCIISQYIWYMQSCEMLRIINILAQKNALYIKSHTDSIGFRYNGSIDHILQDIDIGPNAGQYKIEAQNTRLFMHHQSLYQIEGQQAKGLPLQLVDHGYIEEWETGKRHALDEWGILNMDMPIVWYTLGKKEKKTLKEAIQEEGE